MAPTEVSALALLLEKMRGDINEKLARVEGRQEALQAADAAAQKAADHRHANVMQAISASVPRAEIEKDNAARDARISALEARVGSVELRIWGALAGVAAALAGAVLSALKVGLKP